MNGHLITRGEPLLSDGGRETPLVFHRLLGLKLHRIYADRGDFFTLAVTATSLRRHVDLHRMSLRIAPPVYSL